MAAYLISSADARSVEISGTAPSSFGPRQDKAAAGRSGRESDDTACRALRRSARRRRRSPRDPDTGCRAARVPSRRNSGFEATAKQSVALRPLRCSKDSRTSDSTQLPLPMGTVDLFTTTVKSPRDVRRFRAPPRTDIADRATIGAGRRAHRDEDHIRVRHRGTHNPAELKIRAASASSSVKKGS